MSVAVIGGTGIDEMEEFNAGRVIPVHTRFGDVQIIESPAHPGVYFLPRHGLDHSVPPAQINYRAQIAALKTLGVNCAIGVCAVGSLNPKINTGSLVVLGDFIDLTRHRAYTFFDDERGPVVHTDFTEPYCPEISRAIENACADVGVGFFSNAVYVGVDGPRYESPSEIRLYASWGGDVIGMTNLPEVALAREAGLCYGAVAVATNLAAGLSDSLLGHDAVRAAMASSTKYLQTVINTALQLIPAERSCNCASNKALIL
ncbi:MAG: MTAP family purine nucleoside phosphorylase [Armatimonadetes bacterium]|nr:MTAP family purine nucleoside phosphorylase [Armatimonadota bacterium]